MIEYRLLNVLMVLFSAKIIDTYLDSFHNPKKSHFFIGWIGWGMYILFQYLIMISNASKPLLILIINSFLIFIIYRTLYHINCKTAMFRTIILSVFWMLIEIVTNFVLKKSGTFTISYNFIVGNIISKILMYILVQILKHCKKNNSLTELSFKYWMQLFFIPLVTIYIIHNTFCLTYQNQKNFFFLITTILMILVNYITFEVYDKLGIQQETEKQNLAYEQQLALCNKQAAEREAAYQETRRVRHDINEYLVDLKASIQSGELKEAEKKIDTILESNQIYRNEVSSSGNLVIDSLINYKYSLACQKMIAMKCYVFVPEHLPFDGSDLCIILGNLLDNAIEAVSNLPDKQRHLEISVLQIKGNLSITVQNPYEGNINKNELGQILTNKPDNLNHGLGLLSVQRSVEKYNGEFLTDYNNGLFKSMVLLYPQKNLHDNL